MKKNLAFISLFGLTELYQAIARKLEPEGFSVYWITTNQCWTHTLSESGIPRDKILELVYSRSDFLSDETKSQLAPEIARCEELCDLTVNQVLLMDRFISDKYFPAIGDYVALHYRDIKRFLTDHKIDCVFAEPTNMNDLLTYMICRELDIDYVSPRDMRIPAGHMVFFEGYQQERIVPRSGGGPDINGREFIEEFAEKRSTPFYFEKFKTKRVIYPGKIFKAIGRRIQAARVLKQASLTHYDAWGRVKLTARRTIGSFYLRRICKYDQLADIQGKIAYYGLHVQPENAVDVLGSYRSDQLKLIKDIRRALPVDATLVIKEHPNFLGQRTRRFFTELRNIPNVKLLRHDVSSFDVYSRAGLVVTISGTMAYEAGLLGIPAVTLSPMYFGGLSSVHYCSSLGDLKELTHRLLQGTERDQDADCAEIERLVGHSYKAWWSDPYFDRSSLSEENVDNLARAFRTMLSDDTH